MLRLGALEKRILLECHKVYREDKRSPYEPDLYRDELPGLLWGWKGSRVYRCFLRSRPEVRYRGIPTGEYRVRQASLTRALQTLYQKGLIDAGYSGEATGLNVYSHRRAGKLGIEAKAPMTDAEMDRVIVPAKGYGRPWSYRSIGAKPRHMRTMKSIRLTDEGRTLAGTLAENSLKVKLQSHPSNLT